MQLISLQKGAAAAQIGQVPFGDKIVTLDTDPDADADFFLDTAALMMSLDLVVTCDTSVTHLAGALARPVFTAVPIDRRLALAARPRRYALVSDLRIFRQDATGGWDAVFARIAEAVRGRLA